MSVNVFDLLINTLLQKRQSTIKLYRREAFSEQWE